MDLVDEEHRARFKRGKERSHVPLSLERGAGRLHEGDIQLGGEDLRQRRLAEPRRSGEEHVIEGLSARRCRRDRDRQLVLERLLADEVLEPARPEGPVELVLGQRLGRLDPGVHRRAVLSACAIRSSGRSPAAPSSSSSASWAL